MSIVFSIYIHKLKINATTGFINPAIYSAPFQIAFNDITHGGNQGCGMYYVFSPRSGARPLLSTVHPCDLRSHCLCYSRISSVNRVLTCVIVK